MKQYKKGFTLIELLVVISIIAVLMSILMPALGKVKWQAKMAVCSSNIRQQGIAMATYAADNNGKYPLPIGYPGWFPFGGLGYNEDAYNGRPVSANSEWLPAGQAGLYVGGYIEDPHFFYCPAASTKYTAFGRPCTYETEWAPHFEKEDDKEPTSGTWGNPGPFSGYSYWVGYKFSPQGNTAWDKKLSKWVAKKATSRSDKVIVSDNIMTHNGTSGGQDELQDAELFPVFTNHVQQGEIVGGHQLYNDGSVGLKKLEYFKEDTDKHHVYRIPFSATVDGVSFSSINSWL